MLQLQQVGRFYHSSPSRGSTCCVFATSTPAKPTHGKVWSVRVLHAAAALLRMLHFHIRQHEIMLPEIRVTADGMLCTHSRSKLRSTRHTVQHPFQSHAAVADCVTDCLTAGNDCVTAGNDCVTAGNDCVTTSNDCITAALCMCM